MTAAEKILQIQETLVVEKSGYDPRNEYFYYKAEDVAKAVREHMSEVGLIHRTRILEWNEDNKWDQNGRNRPRITFRAEVIFVDPSDNSEFTTEVMATGSDTGGDKATRKAQVQAFKIAAIDLFIITEEQEKFDSDGDPEAEPVDMTPPAPEAASVNDIVKQIGAFTKGDDATHTGAQVNKIGSRIAKEIYNEEVPTAAWKKDLRVVEGVLKALKSGEVA